MNKQETFDYVVSFLVAQGKQAVAVVKSNVTGQMVCAYRAPDGCKCAAGCLIPDDKYNPKWEGVAVVNSSVDVNDVSTYLQAEHDLHLVSKLQQAHDWATGSEMLNWPDQESWMHHFLERARYIAEEFNLSTEVVDLAEARLGELADARANALEFGYEVNSEWWWNHWLDAWKVIGGR